MPLALVHPAPFLDLAAMIAAEGVNKINPQAVARSQGRGGLSWGYLDPAGACVACSGLLPTGEVEGIRCFEAWFLARPAAAAHMLPFVRWAQLTLAHVSQDGPIEVRAFIAPAHLPGQRIARAIGFQRDALMPRDTWLYRA